MSSRVRALCVECGPFSLSHSASVCTAGEAETDGCKVSVVMGKSPGPLGQNNEDWPRFILR